MQVIKIRKGLNIPLEGVAVFSDIRDVAPAMVVAEPDCFAGFQPKLLVAPGDHVLAGTPVIANKYDERIVITSPVSGVVQEVVRGEKRHLHYVPVLPDENPGYEEFGNPGLGDLSREELRDLLLKSGLWALIRQRPYDVIPNPDIIPRDIYISTFDSSPLAPAYHKILASRSDDFQYGVNALRRLTDGEVHLGLDASIPDNPFTGISGAVLHYFRGPHPAGNVGVQIHHTLPLNKGETVWYLNPADVAAIGILLGTGRADFSRIIAITGPGIAKPHYVRTFAGADMASLLNGFVKPGNFRVVSGNVLTGTHSSLGGYLNFYHHQVTVIPEGDYYEFMGWASPGIHKFSNTRLFLSKLLPVSRFNFDTNYHGGHRPFVVTGQYEKVFPFDIYPVYLLKAIIINDIEKMEKLGIYEVSPEDFALCDYVCTSKTEAQDIVRQGLELMRKEMN